ncbi:MAG: 2-phospho-L-lactate guanylyltransferase [Bryobacteraceae bacterium]|nr:2-phospho-L-lactate guanylyltransferase [Bryobacteraceae bacterium]
MIVAILPVKEPRNAKQRLNGMLTRAQRERLARMMFEDTLEALNRARGIDRVAVVTSDLWAAAHARRQGALVFEEAGQVSHSVSADAACRRAMELGAATALLAPIDVPLATAADFGLLASAARPGVVIVPSADGTGTNALVRTPPDVIESQFGPGSFQAHLRQAQTRGVPAEVFPLPGLMLDIDTPKDVAELLARAPDCRAGRLLQAVCALESRR